MHGLVRCKHERKCSRARRADVSSRDVTIKIPDRGCDQGCEWHHPPEAWAEIWEKSVSWVSWVPAWEEEDWLSWPDKFVRYRRHALIGLRADDVKAVSIEGLCLSLPYVEKPLNSKVIKSFVPELRSRKCFCISGFLCYLYIWVMNILCTFHTSISWLYIWLCNRCACVEMFFNSDVGGVWLYSLYKNYHIFSKLNNK